MSGTRFKLAVTAVETVDLLILAKILNAAVQDCNNANIVPHNDPAIRVITHQIAFAGNGDCSHYSLYEKSYEYCLAQTLEGPNAIFPEGNENATIPVYQAN